MKPLIGTCFIQTLIIGLLYFDVAHTQEKNPVVPTQEIAAINTTPMNITQLKPSTAYNYSLYIGMDMFIPVRQWFDRRDIGYQAVASLRVHKKFHLALEIGRSAIIYNRLDWKAIVRGTYYKVGFNWSLLEYPTDPDQMYYVGLLYVFSPYWQKIQAYPLRSLGTIYTREGLPKIWLVGQWLEPVVGARVALFNSPIYVDASLNLKFLIASSKQESIDPLAIPGFGKNRDSKNLGWKWAIVYKIPIFKGKK